MPVGPTRVYAYWDWRPIAFASWRLRAEDVHDGTVVSDIEVQGDAREAWLEVAPDTHAKLSLFGHRSGVAELLGELTFATSPNAPAPSITGEGGWVRWGSDAFIATDPPSATAVPHLRLADSFSSHQVRRTS